MARLQQAVGLEPVEVEPGLVARDADALGRLVAADGLRLGADEPVEREPHGVGERADALGVGGEGPACSVPSIALTLPAEVSNVQKSVR